MIANHADYSKVFRNVSECMCVCGGGGGAHMPPYTSPDFPSCDLARLPLLSKRPPQSGAFRQTRNYGPQLPCTNKNSSSDAAFDWRGTIDS